MFVIDALPHHITAIATGSALMNIVGVYKEIQDQHMNIVRSRSRRALAGLSPSGPRAHATSVQVRPPAPIEIMICVFNSFIANFLDHHQQWLHILLATNGDTGKQN